MIITRHLIISGHVQGVGYRYYLAHKAQQFHLTGWVRNRHDGSVEAMIQGAPENIEALLVRARRGPPKASVTGIAVSEGAGHYTQFATLPTE